MLRWRLLLGLVFIAGLVGLFWLDYHADPPCLWFFPLAILVSVAASSEVLGLFAARQHDPIPAVVYGGNLLIVLSNAVPIFWPGLAAQAGLTGLAWPATALSLCVMGAFVGEMRRYEKPGGVMVNLALAVFALIYVGLLLSFMIQLRVLGGGTLGMLGLAGMIVVVKMGDIGAYAVGRLLGRHKMAPKLSPGKTVEGAIGGITFSCLAAYLQFQYLMPRLDSTWDGGPRFAWLIFGVVVGVAGMIGDLAESLFKRDMGVKDSSRWMPGFGGVLDLIDSALVAAPFAYLCWTFLVAR